MLNQIPRALIVPFWWIVATRTPTFPNPAALLRLAGHVLIEQHDEWDGVDRRYFGEQSMALLTAETEEMAIP